MSELNSVNPAARMDQLENLVFRQARWVVLLFVGLLWAIKFLEIGFGISLYEFGILPRTLSGLIGILTAPLLHADLYHLISNSLPLIILGLGLFYFYPRIAWEVAGWLYLITGFWVWAAARGGSYHIGASGVVYALAAYLIVGGIVRKHVRLMTISMAVLILYGGIFYGVLPGDPGISWESHLLGAVSGAFMAIYFRKEPIWTIPKPPPKEELVGEEEPGEMSHTHMNANAEFTYTFRPKEEE